MLVVPSMSPPMNYIQDATITHPNPRNHSTWRLAEIKACMTGGEKLVEDCGASTWARTRKLAGGECYGETPFW